MESDSSNRVDSRKGNRGSSKIGAALQALVAGLESLKVGGIKVYPKMWVGGRCRSTERKLSKRKLAGLPKA